MGHPPLTFIVQQSPSWSPSGPLSECCLYGMPVLFYVSSVVTHQSDVMMVEKLATFSSFLEIGGMPPHSSSCSDSWPFLISFYLLYTAYFLRALSSFTVLRLTLLSLVCTRTWGLSAIQIETLWWALATHVYLMASCGIPTCFRLFQLA
jgi:hypothetical protein